MNSSLENFLISVILVFLVAPVLSKIIKKGNKLSDKISDKILPDKWKWENIHPGYYKEEYGEDSDD